MDSHVLMSMTVLLELIIVISMLLVKIKREDSAVPVMQVIPETKYLALMKICV